MVIWLRVGEEDGYHVFDTMEDVAQHLEEFWDVRRLTPLPGKGVTAPGFEGNNYISLYWGTEENFGPVSFLDAEQVAEINESLDAFHEAS